MGTSFIFEKSIEMKIHPCILFVAVSTIVLATVEATCPGVETSDSWPNGMKGTIKFKSPVTFKKGWAITLKFDRPVNQIQPAQGRNGKCTGTTCTFTNQNWNKFAWMFQYMFLGFTINFDEKSGQPQVVLATIADATTPDQKHNICGTPAPTTTTAGTTTAAETTTAAKTTTAAEPTTAAKTTTAAETTTPEEIPDEEDDDSSWWERFKEWIGVDGDDDDEGTPVRDHRSLKIISH